jgi:SAM-dependent methyltransferase
MTRDPSIIELARWLQTSAGRYLLAWEQQRLDAAVSDIFGFHALQLGWPELDGLAANRMPHRWRALDNANGASSAPWVGASSALVATTLVCEFEALPFPTASLDLVVMPHALELARDPHQVLREVERVLVPEGRVVIVGFNPTSLWGLRQRCARMRNGLGLGRERGMFMPRAADFIGYWRLRDWLRLLSFDIEAGRFGCYRPPLASERWLSRFQWMENAGDRWWPVLGAVYFMVAVKRVRGMRLVGLAKTQRTKAKAAPAVAAHNNRQREPELHEH